MGKAEVVLSAEDEQKAVAAFVAIVQKEEATTQVKQGTCEVDAPLGFARLAATEEEAKTEDETDALKKEALLYLLARKFRVCSFLFFFPK